MSYNSKQWNALLAGGAGTKDAWGYLTSSNGETEIDAYGFMPVNGDVEMTALEDDDESVGATKLAYTYYQNIFYPGKWTKMHVTSGTVMYFKNK